MVHYKILNLKEDFVQKLCDHLITDSRNFAHNFGFDIDNSITNLLYNSNLLLFNYYNTILLTKMWNYVKTINFSPSHNKKG